MYFITTICSSEYQAKFLEDRLTSTRTFGYFTVYSDAIEAITNNSGNMVECFYDFLVLETIGPGIHALTETEKWFEWNGKEWKPTVKPKWAAGITNWSVG